MKQPDNHIDEIGGIDNILHDFAVAESLNEMSLADKLKRGVITADEYDDRLVENYRENKKTAKRQIEDFYRNKIPGKKDTEEVMGAVTKATMKAGTLIASSQWLEGYNQAINDITAQSQSTKQEGGQ